MPRPRQRHARLAVGGAQHGPALRLEHRLDQVEHDRVVVEPQGAPGLARTSIPVRAPRTSARPVDEVLGGAEANQAALVEDRHDHDGHIRRRRSALRTVSTSHPSRPGEGRMSSTTAPAELLDGVKSSGPFGTPDDLEADAFEVQLERCSRVRRSSSITTSRAGCRCQWAAARPVPGRPARPARRPGSRCRTRCLRPARSGPRSGRRTARRCACEGQAETGAFLLGGAAALLERLEDALVVLGSDPDAVVGHRHDQLAASSSAADIRHLRGELHRVGQQVQRHLLETPLVRFEQADIRPDLEPERRPAPAPARASATARTRAPPARRTSTAPGPSAQPRPWTGRGCR